MMDLLKRNLAPVLPAAWSLVDEEARRVLALNLAGRKLVDLGGPHGWEFAAVNRGRLRLFETQPAPGVHVGIREVQPLIEVRTPIILEIMELDSVARGARDPDLGPVVEAAEQIAWTEDSAIFNGFPDAGITGIIEASAIPPLSLSKHGARFPYVVAEAKEILKEAGVGGPYGLALGSRAYTELSKATDDGYPIRKRVEQLINGPIVRAPAIDGAVLLSVRGGDFELTIGQDLSIGFAHRDKHTVELFLTESFTFQVLEPLAAVALLYQEDQEEG